MVKPGVLQSMGSQRVRHDWMTELNWTLWQTEGEKVEIVTDFSFLASKIILDSDCSHESKDSQSYTFSSSHVWMWELNHKEDWALKNGWFQILMLEKTVELPLDCKEVKSVNPKGNQPWIFFGRTVAEAPILWPPDVQSQLIEKVSDAGKDWGHEKGAAEDEIVR